MVRYFGPKSPMIQFLAILAWYVFLMASTASSESEQSFSSQFYQLWTNSSYPNNFIIFVQSSDHREYIATARLLQYRYVRTAPVPSEVSNGTEYNNRLHENNMRTTDRWYSTVRRVLVQFSVPSHVLSFVMIDTMLDLLISVPAPGAATGSSPKHRGRAKIIWLSPVDCVQCFAACFAADVHSREKRTHHVVQTKDAGTE